LFRLGVRRLGSQRSREGQVEAKTAQGCPKPTTQYNPRL